MEFYFSPLTNSPYTQVTDSAASQIDMAPDRLITTHTCLGFSFQDIGKWLHNCAHTHMYDKWLVVCWTCRSVSVTQGHEDKSSRIVYLVFSHILYLLLLFYQQSAGSPGHSAGFLYKRTSFFVMLLVWNLQLVMWWVWSFSHHNNNLSNSKLLSGITVKSW